MTGNLPEKNNDKPADEAIASKSSNRVLYILLFVFIIVIGSTSYYVWSELNRSRKAFSDMSRSAMASSSAHEATISKIQNSLAKLAENQESLSNTLAAIQQRESFSNEDIALAEIEYLLVIAMHRLQLERDIDTALAAMQTAERRLRDLGNYQLDPVREQINKDIEQLQNVAVVDVSGLAAYLADLINRVDSLPLKPDVISENENDGDIPGKPVTASRENFLTLIWNELKSLVVIKRNDDVAAPFLLEQEQYYLYQNLRLELENAKLSVLLGDTENLKISITSIKDWLNKYFDVNDTAVANLLSTLDQMTRVDLGPELPDITSSLESLRAYMHESEYYQPEPGNNSGDSAL